MASEKGIPTWIEKMEVFFFKILVSGATMLKKKLAYNHGSYWSQYNWKEGEYTLSMFLKSFIDNKAFCGVISRSLCYKSNTLSWKIVSLPCAKSCDCKSVHPHTAVQGVLWGNHPATLPQYIIYLEDSLQEHWMPTIIGCTFIGRSVKKWYKVNSSCMQKN